MELDARILPLALSIVLGLYTHINTICRVLYPQGMYVNAYGFRECWFLGYDNPSCIILLLAISISMFRIFYYRNHFLIWDWSVLLSGCWFVLVQRIATAIIAVVCFFAFILGSRNERIRKNFSKSLLIIGGMFLLFLLIQIANIQDTQLFSFVFKLLGRDVSFTGRTRAWSMIWREIQNEGWLLGRGLQTSEMYLALFGGHVLVNIHSYYLQVIYEGGFLAFAALFGVLACVAIRFDKGKYGYVYMPFLAGLLALMLMWQTEAYGDLIKYGFVILSLMYNTPLLHQYEGTTNEPHIRLVFNNLRGHRS